MGVVRKGRVAWWSRKTRLVQVPAFDGFRYKSRYHVLNDGLRQVGTIFTWSQGGCSGQSTGKLEHASWHASRVTALVVALLSICGGFLSYANEVGWAAWNTGGGGRRRGERAPLHAYHPHVVSAKQLPAWTLQHSHPAVVDFYMGNAVWMEKEKERRKTR